MGAINLKRFTPEEKKRHQELKKAYPELASKTYNELTREEEWNLNQDKRDLLTMNRTERYNRYMETKYARRFWDFVTQDYFPGDDDTWLDGITDMFGAVVFGTAATGVILVLQDSGAFRGASGVAAQAGITKLAIEGATPPPIIYMGETQMLGDAVRSQRKLSKQAKQALTTITDKGLTALPIEWAPWVEREVLRAYPEAKAIIANTQKSGKSSAERKWLKKNMNLRSMDSIEIDGKTITFVERSLNDVAPITESYNIDELERKTPITDLGYQVGPQKLSKGDMRALAADESAMITPRQRFMNLDREQQRQFVQEMDKMAGNIRKDLDARRMSRQDGTPRFDSDGVRITKPSADITNRNGVVQLQGKEFRPPARSQQFGVTSQMPQGYAVKAQAGQPPSITPDTPQSPQRFGAPGNAPIQGPEVLQQSPQPLLGREAAQQVVDQRVGRQQIDIPTGGASPELLQQMQVRQQQVQADASRQLQQRAGQVSPSGPTIFGNQTAPSSPKAAPNAAPSLQERVPGVSPELPPVQQAEAIWNKAKANGVKLRDWSEMTPEMQKSTVNRFIEEGHIAPPTKPTKPAAAPEAPTVKPQAAKPEKPTINVADGSVSLDFIKKTGASDVANVIPSGGTTRAAADASVDATRALSRIKGGKWAILGGLLAGGTAIGLSQSGGDNKEEDKKPKPKKRTAPISSVPEGSFGISPKGAAQAEANKREHRAKKRRASEANSRSSSAEPTTPPTLPTSTPQPRKSKVKPKKRTVKAPPVTKAQPDLNAEYKALLGKLNENSTQAERDAVRDFGLKKWAEQYPELAAKVRK